MLNVIELQGHLTKDPEVRTTPNGKSVASFSVAVNRDGKDAGCDYINCVAWEQKAEFIGKYFKKGSPIVVKGKLQSRQYEQDGKKRTAYEVIVESSYFGGSKTETTETKREELFTAVEEADGNLPF